jgi:hypothetical protein
MVLFLLVVIVAIVLGIIGAVLLVADLVYVGLRWSRRTSRRPQR